MRVARYPGVSAFVRLALGNLIAPTFASPPTGPGDRTNGGGEPERAAIVRGGAERAVILRGGTILTMDPANPVAEALAIRGEVILDVGPLNEIKRHYTADTEIIDMAGHAVLPGFVEPHVRVLESALAAMDIPAGGEDRRVADMAAGGEGRPAAGAADLAAGGEGRRAAGAADLAAGGEGRRAAGAADFSAAEAARMCAEHPEECATQMAGALEELARRGYTTVYDVAIGELGGAAEHRLLEALVRAPDSPVRVRGAFTPELAAQLGASPGGDERYAVVGISYAVDGSLEEYAAAVGEPYLSGRGSGMLLHEEHELREALRRWHEDGWQLLVRCNGDRATEQALRCLEALMADAGGSSVLHRIDRFAVVGEEQIARVAALGVGVSHPINQVYFAGESLRDDVLGPERAAHLHSLRRELEHGLVSSCQSYHAVAPADPCLALRTATTRLMCGSDDVLGPFQQLTLAEALRTLTVNPAHQVLLGDRIGALRPGMLADLVVLDRDPREVAPERLHELRVIETWLGGRRRRWV